MGETKLTDFMAAPETHAAHLYFVFFAAKGSYHVYSSATAPEVKGVFANPIGGPTFAPQFIKCDFDEM